MKALTLRLDDDTYQALRRRAFEEETSISSLIRDAVAAAPVDHSAAALPALRAEVLAPVAAVEERLSEVAVDATRSAYSDDADTLSASLTRVANGAVSVRRALRAVLADPDAVAERDAEIRAGVAEQIAQAIEAMRDNPARHRYVRTVEAAFGESARIAREAGR